MKQTILCPTDLTVNSRDGVAYGFSLAKKNDAQLIIFHVTSFPRLSQYVWCEMEPYYRWSELVSEFKTDRLLAEAEQRVGRFVCAAFSAESSTVAWKARIGLGEVAGEIVVAAIQERVALIILSRHKKNVLARVFMPSIAEAVSRSAPCPVLSLDPQAMRPAPAWRVPALGRSRGAFDLK